jgi:Na+-transporting methylmalonyl-CoA/oxaloacetate decarboxylase gamma subunit
VFFYRFERSTEIPVHIYPSSVRDDVEDELLSFSEKASVSSFSDHHFLPMQLQSKLGNTRKVTDNISTIPPRQPQRQASEATVLQRQDAGSSALPPLGESQQQKAGSIASFFGWLTGSTHRSKKEEEQKQQPKDDTERAAKEEMSDQAHPPTAEASNLVDVDLDVDNAERNGGGTDELKKDKEEDLESQGSGDLFNDEDDAMSDSIQDGDDGSTVDLAEEREKQIRTSLFFAFLSAVGMIFFMNLIGKIVAKFTGKNDTSDTDVVHNVVEGEDAVAVGRTSLKAATAQAAHSNT